MKVSITTLLDAGIITVSDSEYGYWIGYTILPNFVLKIDGHEVTYIQDITEQGEPEITILQLADKPEDPLNFPQWGDIAKLQKAHRYEFEAEVYKRIG